MTTPREPHEDRHSVENKISGGTFHGPVFQAGSFHGEVRSGEASETLDPEELTFRAEFMKRQRAAWKEEEAARRKKAAEKRAKAEKEQAEVRIGCTLLAFSLVFAAAAFTLFYFSHNWPGLGCAALAYVCFKKAMSD
ncbi:hypothetical protein [Streptomyces californicus]|uniref:hypothetical protein n=1 Tax=Streptomyces californicus TaxID=67351 RepID=UPI0037B6E53F